MERLLFVWDELDDWAGIARHYLAATFDRLPMPVMGSDALTILASLPFLFA